MHVTQIEVSIHRIFCQQLLINFKEYEYNNFNNNIEIYTKEYKINIERSKILSNNTNLTMHVNDELVTFNNFKSDTVYINNNVEKIKFFYFPLSADS